MAELIRRRDLLRSAGLAGIGAALAGCARPSPESSASSPAKPSPSQSASATGTRAGTLSYDQLARQLSGPLLRPGQSGFQPRNLLYNPASSPKQGRRR